MTHVCNLVHLAHGPEFCSDPECPAKRSLRFMPLHDLMSEVLKDADLTFDPASGGAA